jgi:hypothetical protein
MWIQTFCTPKRNGNRRDRKINWFKNRMTIDEIYKKEEISVRSYHVCKYNDLHSVSDLKKYYCKKRS